mmetsp:Transcript_15967/g.30041  ORF Transcript_15967/g.30041 Transcript_15967/m.30041 type:complete len:84 (+) Transcript_15967:120-371(+)
MDASRKAISEDVLREKDVAYEQELQQNPCSVRQPLWAAVGRETLHLLEEQAVEEIACELQELKLQGSSAGGHGVRGQQLIELR